MVSEDSIKEYIFKKLFAPKTVIIDSPGLQFNKSSRRFGPEGTITRVVYNFEDIGVDLYKELVKQIGKTKADETWYKIGKDITTRYLLFGKGKKIPKLILPIAIRHIFKTFSSAGMSFAKEVKFDLEGNTLKTKGKNCVVCRKTGSGYFMAGATSGILSQLLGENFEAVPECTDCPESCIIVADNKMNQIYIPDKEELKPLENYKLNNIKEYKDNEILSTFTDLIRFKKITIDEDGKTILLGKVITPSEIGILGIVASNYKKIGAEILLRDTIKKRFESILEEIFKNPGSKDKIKFIRNLLSAFGFGIFNIKKIDPNIIVDIRHPILTRFDSTYEASIINACVNFITGKQNKMKEYSKERYIFST